MITRVGTQTRKVDMITANNNRCEYGCVYAAHMHINLARKNAKDWYKFVV